MVRALLFVVIAATTAHAEPNDLVARPLVLDRYQVHAELVADINLAPGQLARSTSLSPDVWVGVTPELTVGLIHSNPSVDRFAPGATFCVRHQDIGCTTTYHGSGIDVRWRAVAGDLAVAARGRLVIRELNPFKPALLAGALVRWTGGRYAITGDPYIQLGLANTDEGNRHALFLPVMFSVQPLPRWEIALRTGWNADFAVIRDGWHIPVALATRVRATDHLELGTMLAYASLLGPQNTAKERALFFMLGWRT